MKRGKTITVLPLVKEYKNAIKNKILIICLKIELKIEKCRKQSFPYPFHNQSVKNDKSIKSRQIAALA